MERIGIVFDLDGTLLDTSCQISSALFRCFYMRGLPAPSKENIFQFTGLPLPIMLQKFLVPEMLIKEITIEFRDYLSDLIEEGTPSFSGAVDLLEKLYSLNYCVGIATSKPTELAKKTLKFSELNNFPLLIQGTENFPPKPNPEILKKLSAQLYEAKIKVMIGDRKEDMETAMNFDITAVGVAQTSHTELELREAGADLAFPNIAELLNSFEKFRDFITLAH